MKAHGPTALEATAVPKKALSKAEGRLGKKHDKRLRSPHQPQATKPAPPQSSEGSVERTSQPWSSSQSRFIWFHIQVREWRLEGCENQARPGGLVQQGNVIDSVDGVDNKELDLQHVRQHFIYSGKLCLHHASTPCNAGVKKQGCGSGTCGCQPLFLFPDELILALVLFSLATSRGGYALTRLPPALCHTLVPLPTSPSHPPSSPNPARRPPLAQRKRRGMRTGLPVPIPHDTSPPPTLLRCLLPQLIQDFDRGDRVRAQSAFIPARLRLLHRCCRCLPLPHQPHQPLSAPSF